MANVIINKSIEKCIDTAKDFERSEIFFRFEFEPLDTHRFRFAQVPRDIMNGRYVELELSPKPARSAPRIEFTLEPLTNDSCSMQVKYSFWKGLITFYLTRGVIMALIVILLGFVTDGPLWWVIAGVALSIAHTGIIGAFMHIDKKRFLKNLIRRLNADT